MTLNPRSSKVFSDIASEVKKDLGPAAEPPKIDSGNTILDMKNLVIQKSTGLPERPVSEKSSDSEKSLEKSEDDSSKESSEKQ